MPATVLYVSEESKKRWIARRDKLGIKDNVHFWTRPFKGKPTPAKWLRFVEAVKRKAEEIDANLIVFDTISAVWPVRDENDAGQVQEALMPLWCLTERSAMLLVHHLKKGDGQEGTGSRGSGALTGFVDTICELRRHDAKDAHSRKRVLTSYGRGDDVPKELVLELSGDGMDYVAIGTRLQDRFCSFFQGIF